MLVLLTGGGTGGHITPILAVAHELKQLQPDITVGYVGERHGKFTELTSKHPAIDKTYAVFAGKFRRYHKQSWLVRLTDIKTNFLNFRDGAYVLFGIIQAWFMLGRIKPDVVFLKGGFVGVPIGLAAAARRIPIVTHDSDALPGLANRLVSRWAAAHATALPAQYYNYPQEKTRPVGVLVEHSYQPVTPALQAQYKHTLGINSAYQVLLITGASSGAARLNEAVVSFVVPLLQRRPNLYVIHQVGKGKSAVYGDIQHERLNIQEFLNPMYQYMGAADLVVTRASGNTIAELGVQGKACIAIPNPDLTGGHQLKNAALLEEQGAARVVKEIDLYDAQKGLVVVIEQLLSDEAAREQLSLCLQGITIQGAARKLAELLLDQTAKNKN
ncbi:MAG TPA: glycosyltransferase [Candidatus Limnocylindrales bacterium]|nr:glycosyltransferase [Candidatus Limnocylindrales bacterium]